MKQIERLKHAVIFRTQKNVHRYFYFLNGKLRSFETHEKDVLSNLAMLFGCLMQAFSTPSSTFIRIALLFGLSGLLANANAAYALPTGYDPVSGNVQFSQPDANTLNINTSSSRSIVNYQTFNIGHGETVNFNLPGSSSVILNRVIGGSPSQIFGNMNSNGHVFLVNPSGILFGSSAQVNVGSLTASTLNISNDDFMAGRYIFAQPVGSNPAAVVNQGSLQAQNAGSVNLIGGAIQNSGTIAAPNGSVNLAVGEQASMVIGNDLKVDVTVDEALQSKVAGYQDAISNSGSIQANGGAIKAQAELANSFYDRAVNNTGIMKAQGADFHEGSIELVGSDSIANSGTLDVSGTANTPDGGQIAITSGKDIVQQGNILAEGADGGTGGHVEINAAQETTLEGGSLISVKGAGAHSNAGSVRIWSDENTYFKPNAHINAEGGSASGDAGFVEISAKDTVYVQSIVDLLAPHGHNGTLLIDPTNITFATGDPTYDPATVGGQAGNLLYQATNNITISNTLDFTNADSVTMEAGNALTVNAALSASKAGADLNLTAFTLDINHDVSASDQLTLTSTGYYNGSDAIDVAGGRTLTANTITLQTTYSGGNSSHFVVNGNLDAPNINILNNTANSRNTINGNMLNVSNLTSTGNSFIYAGSQALNLASGFTFAGAGNDYAGAGVINITPAITSAGAINLSSTGTVTVGALTAATDLTLSSGTSGYVIANGALTATAGDVNITAGTAVNSYAWLKGAVTAGDDITVSGWNLNIDHNMTAADQLTLNTNGYYNGSDAIDFIAGKTMTANTITMQSSYTGGSSSHFGIYGNLDATNINILNNTVNSRNTIGGNMLNVSNLTSTGNSFVYTGSQALNLASGFTFTSTGNDFNGAGIINITPAITSTGAVSLTAPGSVTVGAITAATDLTLTSGTNGIIIANGALTATSGDVNITAGTSGNNYAWLKGAVTAGDDISVSGWNINIDHNMTAADQLTLSTNGWYNGNEAIDIIAGKTLTAHDITLQSSYTGSNGSTFNVYGNLDATNISILNNTVNSYDNITGNLLNVANLTITGNSLNYSGAQALNLSSGFTFATTANSPYGNGNVSITPGITSTGAVSITSTAGSVTVGAITAATDLTLSSSSNIVANGTLTATSGDVNITAGTAVNSSAWLKGAVTAGDDISVSGWNINIDHNMTAADQLTLNTNGWYNGWDAIDFIAGKTMTANTITMQSSYTGGNSSTFGIYGNLDATNISILNNTVNSYDTITGNMLNVANLTVTGNSFNYSGAQALNLSSGFTFASTANGPYGNGNVSITPAITSTGAVSITSTAGSVTVGAITAATDLTLSSNSNIVANGALTATAGDVNVTAGTAVNNSAWLKGAVTAGDDISVSGWNINIDDNMTAPDQLTLNTNGWYNGWDAIDIASSKTLTANTITMQSSYTGGNSSHFVVNSNLNATNINILNNTVNSRNTIGGNMLNVSNLTSTGNTFIYSGAQALNLASGFTFASTGNDYGGAGYISITPAITSAGAVSLTSTNGPVTVGAVTAATDITLSGTTVTANGALTATAGDVNVTGGTAVNNNAWLKGTVSAGDDISVSGWNVNIDENITAADQLNVTTNGYYNGWDAIDIAAGKTLTAHDISLTSTHTAGNSSVLAVNGNLNTSAANGNINLIGPQMYLNGNINAGSGTVTIAPNRNIAMEIGGNSNDSTSLLSITATELSHITAGTVNIGSTSYTGNLTVAGNIDISGGGRNYDLNLLNGGNITTTGNTITTGANDIGFNAAGSLSLGTINSAGGGGQSYSFGGDYTLNSDLSGSNITIQTTANNGAINITGGNITATNNITLGTQGTGNITLGSGHSLTSSGNGTITLSSNNIDIQGTVNSGASGNVILKTNANGKDMTVNGAGTYDVSSAEMGRITTGTLQIGDTALTGGLTVAGNVDVSSLYNLTLKNGGVIDNNATITLGNKTLNETALGALNTGNISGTGANINLTSSGTLTVDGTVNSTGASTVALTTASGSNGAITLSGNLSGQTVNIDSDGSGAISQTTGTVTATNVSMTSDSGNIGASGSPIVMDADNLTVTTTGNAYAQDTDDVTLNASSANTFSLATASGSNGSIAVNGNLTATTVTLDADGSGNITRTAGSLNGTTVNLSSDTGNIGSSGSEVRTAATTLTVNTAGNANLIEANGVTLGNSSANNLDIATASGSNGGIVINGTVNGTTSATLDADGTGTITRTAGSVTGGTVNLSSDSGNIGSSGSEVQTSATTLTVNTTGNANLIEANGVTLGNSSANNLNIATASGGNGSIAINGTVNGATGVTLDADGSGNITRTSGTITGPTISLSSDTGNIGSSGSEVRTTATTLTVNTGGNANLIETNGVTLGNSSANNLNIATASGSNGAIVLNGTLNGTTSLTLDADGSGTITRSAGSLTGGTVNLSSDSGNIGGAGTEIQTNATGLTINTSGDANITESNSISLGASTADDLTLTTLSNGSIALTGNVTTTHSAALTANGSGAITQSSGTLTAPTLTLTSTSGNIGNSGSAIHTQADTATLSTSGSGYLGDQDALTLGAISLGGALQVSAGDALTTSGALSGTSIILQTTGNNGNLTVSGGNITGTSVTLATQGSGTLAINGGRTVSSSNGALSLTSDQMTLNGNVNAGSGTLTISTANAGTSIGLGGGSGTLDLSTTELSHLSAGTLEIGSTSTTGTINVGNVDLTSQNAALTLRSSGSILDATLDEAANIILGNNKSLTLTGGSGNGSGIIGAVGDGDLDVTLAGTGMLNLSTNNQSAYFAGAYTLGTHSTGSSPIFSNGTQLNAPVSNTNSLLNNTVPYVLSITSAPAASVSSIASPSISAPNSGGSSIVQPSGGSSPVSSGSSSGGTTSSSTSASPTSSSSSDSSSTSSSSGSGSSSSSSSNSSSSGSSSASSSRSSSGYQSRTSRSSSTESKSTAKEGKRGENNASVQEKKSSPEKSNTAEKGNTDSSVKSDNAKSSSPSGDSADKGKSTKTDSRDILNLNGSEGSSGDDLKKNIQKEVRNKKNETDTEN